MVRLSPTTQKRLFTLPTALMLLRYRSWAIKGKSDSTWGGPDSHRRGTPLDPSELLPEGDGGWRGKRGGKVFCAVFKGFGNQILQVLFVAIFKPVLSSLHLLPLTHSLTHSLTDAFSFSFHSLTLSLTPHSLSALDCASKLHLSPAQLKAQVRACARLCMCVHMCKCVCVCIYCVVLCLCVCPCACIVLCVCSCMCAFVYICMCECVRVCVVLCVHACACVCVYVLCVHVCAESSMPAIIRSSLCPPPHPPPG